MVKHATAVEVIRKAALDSDSTRAVIATDDAGTIVYWNDAAEDLYGWTAADAVGRNILDVTPAIMSQADAARIMELLLQGRQWNGAFMVRNRDGTPMMVQVRDVPVMHEGTVVGIIGISYVGATFGAD